MNIILLGIPGSGKSTQAKKISEFFQIPYLGTGNLVREALDKDFIEYKGSVAKGFLLPDNVVFKIVTDKICKFDLNKGFVMEGYPRTIVQAELLDLFLLEKKSKLDTVINLFVNNTRTVESRIISRRQCMLCGAIIDKMTGSELDVCPKCHSSNAFRTDDCEESVQNRIKEYNEKTISVSNYYEGKGIICHIDASESIENVFDSILKAVHSTLRSGMN